MKKLMPTSQIVVVPYNSEQYKSLIVDYKIVQIEIKDNNLVILELDSFDNVYKFLRKK